MIWFVLYISSIVAANATLALVGLVPVGFGLMAPAGVLWAGLSLTLRDLVQDRLGRWPVVGAILLGAGMSWLFAPSFAAASGVAFLVSELADCAVYTPIKRRSWLGAVALSNTVGLLVDSWLFLTLALGDTTFLPGLVLGKVWVTLATVAVLWPIRQRREAWACS